MSHVLCTPSLDSSSYIFKLVFSRSYCYTVWSAIGSSLLSVCLSVCLWRCAFWLSGLVYGAKSCSNVFLAYMFLFVPFDTFCRMYRLATKCTTINELTRARNAITDLSPIYTVMAFLAVRCRKDGAVPCDRRVPTKACAINSTGLAGHCRCRQRCADCRRRSAVIVASRTDSKRIFYSEVEMLRS